MEYGGEKRPEDLKTKVAHSILNCNDKPFVALDLDYTVNQIIDDLEMSDMTSLRSYY
jgi:hypothetical protein